MGNTFDVTSGGGTFDILSNTKGQALLTKLQLSPEIGTENSSYASECLEIAAAFILEYCQFTDYPELRKGYTDSGFTPSVDISGIENNNLLISVNGSQFSEILLTLASCTTGALTAAEIQTQIRAQSSINGWDEVTVAYDSTSGAEKYTITSGRYGEGSIVGVSFQESLKDVAKNLKFSRVYGGLVVHGDHLDREIDKACVRLAQSIYARQGAEGVSTGGGDGLNLSFEEIDPIVRRILNKRRRLMVMP